MSNTTVLEALAERAQTALEDVGEWGYAAALRDAGHDEEMLVEALRDAPGPLEEYAMNFALADEIRSYV